MDILPNGHFANGHFVQRTFRRKDNLPNAQFAENRDVISFTPTLFIKLFGVVTQLSCCSLAISIDHVILAVNIKRNMFTIKVNNDFYQRL